MKTVTAIKTQNGHRGRINIFVDNALGFGLEAEVVAEAGLRTGQRLTAAQIDELIKSDIFQRCYKSALKYLSYRPLSEMEIKRRLIRRGYDTGIVEGVLTRLKEYHLVDDTAFAQFWGNNRQSFSPRSKQLVKRELWQKGVAAVTIDQVIEDFDDEVSAYQAAQKKARFLEKADYTSFRRRLGNFLRSRGFSYDIINQVVEQVWHERGDS